MDVRNDSNRVSSFDTPDTNNATYFLSDDVHGFYPADFRLLKKSAHFAYLREVNEGLRLLNRYSDPYITREAARDLIEALSSQLELTAREKAQARRNFLSLDREKLGLSLDLVAYCVCAFAVEKNEKNVTRRCHPNIPEDDRDDQFNQVAKSLGLTDRNVVKTYGKIQHRLDKVAPAIREDFDNSDDFPREGT